MNKYRDENGHWTTKENNNGPCYHSDIFENEDINYERILSYNIQTAYQDAKKLFDKVQKQGKYGTFDFNGNEITDRYNKKGFQVSIFRPEIKDVLSEDEINNAVKIIIDYLEYLDYPDIGVYDSAELSHYSNNKKKALNIAKLFNQESILNWNKTANKDNGYFIKNPYYDENKKLTRDDYFKAIEALKNEK